MRSCCFASPNARCCSLDASHIIGGVCETAETRHLDRLDRLQCCVAWYRGFENSASRPVVAREARAAFSSHCLLRDRSCKCAHVQRSCCPAPPLGGLHPSLYDPRSVSRTFTTKGFDQKHTAYRALGLTELAEPEDMHYRCCEPVREQRAAHGFDDCPLLMACPFRHSRCASVRQQQLVVHSPPRDC